MHEPYPSTLSRRPARRGAPRDGGRLHTVESTERAIVVPTPLSAAQVLPASCTMHCQLHQLHQLHQTIRTLLLPVPSPRPPMTQPSARNYCDFPCSAFGPRPCSPCPCPRWTSQPSSTAASVIVACIPGTLCSTPNAAAISSSFLLTFARGPIFRIWLQSRSFIRTLVQITSTTRPCRLLQTLHYTAPSPSIAILPGVLSTTPLSQRHASKFGRRLSINDCVPSFIVW